MDELKAALAALKAEFPHIADSVLLPVAAHLAQIELAKKQLLPQVVDN